MYHKFPISCCKYCLCDYCLSKDDIIDKNINQELKRFRRQNFHEKKLLLLGNAEAGKSTFLKQMKLIHGRGFKPDEKRRIIPLIYQQIINVIRCICRAMQNLQINYEKIQNEEYVQLINSSDDIDNILRLSPKIVEAIKNIWLDEGIQRCYDRRREYSLTDSAKYFLDNIDRICKEDYIPSDGDLLRVRVRTTGIVQEDFQFSHVRLQVLDVGGQKTERRKWIHCFDNVTSIIFLASLIEYDQHVEEQLPEENRMKESVALFRVIRLSDYFIKASVILFLNKTDLFEERLSHKPLRDTYPDFNGENNDVEAAKEFIKNKYLQETEPEEFNSKKDIYPHFTCSIDTKNIRIVFESVKDTILAQNLYHWAPY